MFRKLNKRGMTLIEMMVVVAIIAILVSIIIPVVNSYTARANAATNAANLRSIEGQISTMLVSNPTAFDDGNINDTVEQVIKDKANEIIDSTIEEIVGFVPNGKWYESLKNEVVNTLGLAVDAIADSVLQDATFYAKNGVITFDDGTTITAPTSKPISIAGIELRKGTEMTITITDTEIIATYDGLTRDCFAIIAEEGEGTTAGSNMKHSYRDGDGDGVCDTCKGTQEHSVEEIIGGAVDGAFGDTHSCSSKDGDHACDQSGCTGTLPCKDENSDCVCDVGKETMTHGVKKTWGRITCCGHAENAPCHG